MYNLEQLKDRIIWLFREPRSGSTWLTKELSFRLKRKPEFLVSKDERFIQGPERSAFVFEYFDKIVPKDDDNKKLFHTHAFDGLKIINRYVNPILLRCIRRNKTDQFCSRFVVKNFTNIYNINTDQEYKQLPKIESITIPISKINSITKPVSNIEHYIRGHIQKEQQWNQYSSPYENETIYYEDLLEDNTLKLFDIGMNTINEKNASIGHTIKLPYDYKKIIVNYDEIDLIMKEYFDF